MNGSKFSAKYCNQKKSGRKNQSLAVGSHSHGNMASFLQYRSRKKLHAGAPFSCENALKDEESSRGACSDLEKSLECSVELSQLRKFLD